MVSLASGNNTACFKISVNNSTPNKILFNKVAVVFNCDGGTPVPKLYKIKILIEEKSELWRENQDFGVFEVADAESVSAF